MIVDNRVNWRNFKSVNHIKNTIYNAYYHGDPEMSPDKRDAVE
jgi:hypothetical protein